MRRQGGSGGGGYSTGGSVGRNVSGMGPTRGSGGTLDRTGRLYAGLLLKARCFLRRGSPGADIRMLLVLRGMGSSPSPAPPIILHGSLRHLLVLYRSPFHCLLPPSNTHITHPHHERACSKEGRWSTRGLSHTYPTHTHTYRHIHIHIYMRELCWRGMVCVHMFGIVCGIKRFGDLTRSRGHVPSLSFFLAEKWKR